MESSYIWLPVRFVEGNRLKLHYIKSWKWEEIE
jgi:hypothetical protein